MKKISIIVLISILSINSYSQIKFEKGYYIDNEGRKNNCLIKNIDWMHNPAEFTYRLTENSEPKLAKIKDVAEFGIDNISKYKRFTVHIDRSSEDLDKMSTNKNPEFRKEQLFLKTLVQGKATLYFYREERFKRYFFSIDSLNAVQLIYKSYYVSKMSIAENNSFRQQLYTDFKCQSFSAKDIEKIRYDYNDLIKFFTAYNNCQNSEVINLGKNIKRDLFNLTIRPGLNASNLTVQSPAYGNINFNTELNFRLGIEAEFVLSYNKNKWAVIIEPTFQSYKSNVINPKTQDTEGNVDYKSIELPIGIRHFFFLNDKSKIFVNGLLIFDKPIDSKLSVKGNNLEVKSRMNFAFGAGYKYNNKYSVELRYGFNRQLLSDYLFYKSSYNTFSFVIGYTIF